MFKICFFSGDVTRNGGTERVSIMIANQLCKQEEYRVLFLSLVEQKEVPSYEIAEGIERFALGKKWLSPGPGYLPLIPKLRKFLRDQEIDLIIDIDIVLDVLSVPASRGLKTKVLSWEHSNCEYELAHGYRHFIVKLFTKRTDWIVTLTPGDAERFKELMKREDRISAIFNPAEEPALVEDVTRENWIITVARLVPGKGFDLLAKVAKEVLPFHLDWKWILCGDGPEQEMLESFIRENQLENQLILEGYVPDVEKYLAKSKLFVLTSRAEGLPMCLLEARSYGLPCVSFDVPTGPADIIQEGENGYLIAPFDCEKMAERIRTLLQDAELLEGMSAKALENLERFRMPQVMASWNEVIMQLLG